MRKKATHTRSAARNPYDTYLSWWFKYSRNNQMYRTDETKPAQPLDYTSFNRRYDQMRRANITNPARMVAMESREASEAQLLNTWRVMREQWSPMQMKGIYGKNLTLKDFRKNYKEIFDLFFGDMDTEDKNDLFSPKEEIIRTAA